MSAIVDFPALLQEELALFDILCDSEPARRHFAEYHDLLDCGRPIRRLVASTENLSLRRISHA
jgi:hypothetical protein